MDANRRRNRRSLRPVVEFVESRALQSGVIATMAANARPATVVRTKRAADESFFHASTDVSPTMATPPGRPTKATLRQSSFQATFVGPYHLGPGRTSAESRQVYIRGAGRSTAFLHGTLQLRFIVPTDPAVEPVGLAVLLDRNINNSGQIGLDLTAVPGSTDRLGRVTRFTWTVDNIYSSGSYGNASGQGTLKVKYAAPPAPGKTSAASLIFRGHILSMGVGDPTATSDLDPGRGGA